MTLVLSQIWFWHHLRKPSLLDIPALNQLGKEGAHKKASQTVLRLPEGRSFGNTAGSLLSMPQSFPFLLSLSIPPSNRNGILMPAAAAILSLGIAGSFPVDSHAQELAAPVENGNAFTHTAAEHFYTIGPAPDWVTPRAPDLKSPAPFDGPLSPGVFFRLVDYQLNAETQEEYHHFTSEFLTIAGVHEESEFQIEFDPAYQQLSIHRILLHRNGNVIDILDPETIRITVPEDELSDGLLDGHVSVLLFLEDVRPGDFVEYDYTLSGSNPVFEGVFFDTISMEWETSVQSVSYRLLKKKERPLHSRNHGIQIAPAIKALPNTDLEEWVWKRESIPPKIIENRLPAWYRPFAYVELSEFADWQAVASWGARHYDFSHLPIDPDLAKEVEKIRKDHPTPETRTIAAIRFVQDSIRYLGIEDGANAFRPAQPNQCFRRRFGDCKDKVVLLGQMLRELGIDSDPVCVDHDLRQEIEKLIPSPLAFDHVVIRIALPSGKILWCDATDSHQGGTVDTLAFPGYGRGLVLNPATTELAVIPDPDPELNRTEIVETFHIGDIGEPTVLEIESTFTGAEADGMRYHLGSSEPSAVRHAYLNYYRENYLQIVQEAPIEVVDDRETNRLVVTEHYRVPDPWEPDSSDPGWYTFTLYLQTIRDLLSQPDHTLREMPFATVHPENSRHEIRLHLPGTDEDWADYFDEERYLIESTAGVFERWMTYDPKKVYATVVGTYRTKANAVRPEDLSAFDKSIADIYDLTSFELWEVNEAEEAAAATTSSQENFGGSDDEDLALALGIGIGALIIGVFAFGSGCLLVFLIMRSRKPPTPLPPFPANRPGPPPLPPGSGAS
ncbi:MAG: DUF3857 domain-containing protein [Verrucomicrobiae bacterium]|nr:DUF3857 domain-containing protein [Verrucomicrobiae bacterium]